MLTYAGSFHANVWIAASHPKAEIALACCLEKVDDPDTGNLDNHSWASRKRRPDFQVETATHRTENHRSCCCSDRVAENGSQEIASPNADPHQAAARTRVNMSVEWTEEPACTARPGEYIDVDSKRELSPALQLAADI